MAQEDVQGIQIHDANGRLANTITVTGEAADILRQVSQAVTSPTRVTLQRPATDLTEDQALWVAIRNRTQALSFNRYNAFINALFCTPPLAQDELYDEVQAANQFGAPSLKTRTYELGRHSIYGVEA